MLVESKTGEAIYRPLVSVSVLAAAELVNGEFLKLCVARFI
jgi:hypothetical protein